MTQGRGRLLRLARRPFVRKVLQVPGTLAGRRGPVDENAVYSALRYIYPRQTMKEILVPISPGELLDKITILEIKSERIADAQKVDNVRHELELLSQVWADSVEEDDVIEDLRQQLKIINEELWEIEDDIRGEEREERFGETFIQLARDVYVTNDKRAQAKRDLNLHLGSDIVEEKSYEDYT